MKVHKLKLKSRFMSMKCLGNKSWEMRKNDRNFQLGDFVTYIEVDDDTSKPIDNPCHDYNLYHIDSILTHNDFEHIPDGYVIWSESAASPMWMKHALLSLAE